MWRHADGVSNDRAYACVAEDDQKGKGNPLRYVGSMHFHEHKNTEGED